MTYKKILLSLILFFPATLSAYLIFAVGLSFITVNNSFYQTRNGIPVYVSTNGIHTDIVVPAYHSVYDWKQVLQVPEDMNDKLKFISFGWGDKGFYIHTPTWADLKFTTAFNALFWLGASAVHVTYHSNTLAEDNQIRKILISEAQYKKLIRYIQHSFERNKEGKFILIPFSAYGENDQFYEGKGKYNLFKTCNVWTNSGLKYAGIRTAVWSPFAWSVMNKFE